jgi:hypothetical protein
MTRNERVRLDREENSTIAAIVRPHKAWGVSRDRNKTKIDGQENQPIGFSRRVLVEGPARGSWVDEAPLRPGAIVASRLQASGVWR